LSEEPKFGLRLKEEFEARTGSLWPLNVGQVYTTLQRLERDGSVVNIQEAGTSPSQRLYRLTGDGRHDLEDWLTNPPTETVPPRDELVIKIMVALSVPGIDIMSIIQVHRRQTIEAMQQLTAIKRRSEETELLMVVDAQLFRLEGVVRWLDSCEARLANGYLPGPMVEGAGSVPDAGADPVLDADAEPDADSDTGSEPGNESESAVKA